MELMAVGIFISLIMFLAWVLCLALEYEAKKRERTLKEYEDELERLVGGFDQNKIFTHDSYYTREEIVVKTKKFKSGERVKAINRLYCKASYMRGGLLMDYDGPTEGCPICQGEI